jgi:hypothetical protein
MFTTHRRLNRSDVDFLHGHHRVKGPFGGSTVWTGERLRQDGRRNLPVQPPFVLAPATLALLATVADNGFPVAIRLSLVVGRHLKREGPVVLDTGAAVESDAGNSHYGKLDGQDLAFFARWIVTRRSMHRTDGGMGKGLSVKTCRSFGVVIEPETDGVLGWMGHRRGPD